MMVALHYSHNEAGSVYSMLQQWQEGTDQSLEELYSELCPESPRPTAVVPDVLRSPYELWTIARRKPPGMNGPEPVNLSDIQLLRELGNELQGWELHTLLAVDRAWLEQLSLEKGRNTQ